MEIREWEEILAGIQFRDYHLQISNDIYGPRLFVFCRYMDRDESKEYFARLRKQKNLSPWVTATTVPVNSTIPINYEMKVPPSVPSKHAKVGFDFDIPFYIENESQAVDYIFSCIMNQERHEAEEDFYYKGKRVKDPHRK